MQTNSPDGRELHFGLEHYDVFSDFAGQFMFKRLDLEYPGSKIILTVRNLQDWLNSREAHVRRNRMNEAYQHSFLKLDRDNWSRQYQRVLHEVTSHFSARPDELLILNIPGGDIPMENFPHENSKPLKNTS